VAETTEEISLSRPLSKADVNSVHANPIRPICFGKNRGKKFLLLADFLELRVAT
jgi:hypothetical protein